MEHFHTAFLKKDITLLKNDLNNIESLSLIAKIALKDTIHERDLSNEFPRSKLNLLNEQIEAEMETITSLDYLKNLGLGFNQEENSLNLFRSKKAFKKDFWTITIILLLILLSFIADFKLQLINKKFTFSVSSLLVVFVFFCARGIPIIYKVLNRTYIFKDFAIKKNNGKIKLAYRPNFELEHVNFDADGKMVLNVHEKYASVDIVDNQKAVQALKFHHLDFKTVETLKVMVDRFNKC